MDICKLIFLRYRREKEKKRNNNYLKKKKILILIFVNAVDFLCVKGREKVEHTEKVI